MPEAKTKKVTEKSTKQELWEAYHQLIDEMINLPTETSPKKSIGTADFIKNITDLKLSVNHNLDNLASDLLTRMNEIAAFKAQLEIDKKAILEDMQTKKTALENELAKIKLFHLEEEKNYQKKFQLEREQLEIDRRRAEDEYQYQLSQKRRGENDAFAQKQAAVEAKLQERETLITKREKEIIAMEKTIQEMPQTIDQAVQKAVLDKEKELIQKYSIEITNLKTEMEYQKNIRELKIANLEKTIQSQADENISLQSQQLEANRQLKDMAIAAIEGKSNKDKKDKPEDE